MPPGDPILSPRMLNRALLARQLLLERANLSIAEAVEQVGGLQTQYAPSGYVGLWTRLRAFPREALTSELEDRTVVQATLLRTTIHIVSRREYWRYAAGVRQARRAWALRIPGRDGGEAAMVDAAARIRSALSNGPRTTRELGELGAGFVGNLGLWVDLVRVPPSGTWQRRRADRLGLAEDWVGPQDATEAEGVAHLVRAYLRAFGPRRGATSPRGQASPLSMRSGPAMTSRCGGFATRTVASSSICPTRRCPTPRHRRRSASCLTGTPACSSTPVARASCRNPIGPASSAAATRSRSGRCSSMDGWSPAGRSAMVEWSLIRTRSWRRAIARPWNGNARRWRPSTPDASRVPGVRSRRALVSRNSGPKATRIGIRALNAAPLRVRSAAPATLRGGAAPHRNCLRIFTVWSRPDETRNVEIWCDDEGSFGIRS